MNLFESVKAAVTVRQAAEHYGLEVGRSGMTRCPFHDDRHPSLKLNESYFYCFGCGATGDVIDFVARLFGLSSYEAAQKLAYDFGIDPDKPPAAAALEKPKYPLARTFRQEELHCQRVLCDYLHLLERWKVKYAPNSPDCYFVVELKTVEFEPEFAGKLSFYLSAVDGEMKSPDDNPTIGLLLCKGKDKMVAEYALKDVNKPMGVSEYKLSNHISEELQDKLPSIEDIEKRIN